MESRYWWAWTFVCAVGIGLSRLGCYYFEFSSNLSFAPLLFNFFMGLLMIGTTAAFIIIIWSLVRVIFSQQNRKKHTVLLLAALLCLILFLKTSDYEFELRMKAYERIAQRSEALIQAIKGYETEHGKAPKELSYLVPKYLSAIPKTGLTTYPDYLYNFYEPMPYQGMSESLGKQFGISASPALPYHGNSWTLVVQQAFGFRELTYWPNQDYKKLGWFKSVEKWAYTSG